MPRRAPLAACAAALTTAGCYPAISEVCVRPAVDARLVDSRGAPLPDTQVVLHRPVHGEGGEAHAITTDPQGGLRLPAESPTRLHMVFMGTSMASTWLEVQATGGVVTELRPMLTSSHGFSPCAPPDPIVTVAAVADADTQPLETETSSLSANPAGPAAASRWDRLRRTAGLARLLARRGAPEADVRRLREGLSLARRAFDREVCAPLKWGTPERKACDEALRALERAAYLEDERP